MSTQNQGGKGSAASSDGMAPTSTSPVALSETTPLLREPPDITTNVPGRRPHLPLSPVTLITPVAVLFTLATYLPATTVFDAIRKLVCRYWYLTNDPMKIPPDGSLPSSLCSIPAVDQGYSTALSITAIVEGIACTRHSGVIDRPLITYSALVAYGLLSSIANKYGRKPALLTVITFSVCADVSILITAILPDALVICALLLWLFFEAMAVVTVFGFIVNTYVVDVVPAEQR